MKIFALMTCAVLMSSVVANAQNAPVPGARPDLPGFAANSNQPAPGARPMPGRPGMQLAPRIITTREPIRLSGGETVIYNGVRVSVPPGVEATVSMDGNQLKVDAPSMEGITIGNATYNTIEPGTEQQAEEQQKPAAPATVFVNPYNGSVSIPRGGTPVFVTVKTGDVIEINTYISLKGDISGALSQEAPSAPADEPETPAEPAIAAPVSVQTEQPETSAPSAPENVTETDTSDVESSDTETNIIDEVEQSVEPTVAEETQGEQVKEEEYLSPSVR